MTGNRFLPGEMNRRDTRDIIHDWEDYQFISSGGSHDFERIGPVFAEGEVWELHFQLWRRERSDGQLEVTLFNDAGDRIQRAWLQEFGEASLSFTRILTFGLVEDPDSTFGQSGVYLEVNNRDNDNAARVSWVADFVKLSDNSRSGSTLSDETITPETFD